MTGVFNLYYYSANFNLESTKLFFRNGLLVSQQDVINESGELIRPQVVLQKLRIKTQIAPASISSSEVSAAELRGDAVVVILKVTLEALLGPVTIRFPTMVENLIAPVIFRNINTNEVSIVESKIAGLSYNDIITVDVEPISRFLIIGLQSRFFPPGEYEVIPYLLIEYESLPSGLLESLGEDVEALGPNYLKLPIMREASRIVLTN